MTTEPGQSTAALYSLQSNNRSARPGVLQTDSLVQSSTFSRQLVLKQEEGEALPTVAEGQWSLHNIEIAVLSKPIMLCIVLSIIIVKDIFIVNSSVAGEHGYVYCMCINISPE